MTPPPARLLIIRFSSFGDVLQAEPVPRAFKNVFPLATVDWLVRADFADVLRPDPGISRVIAFPRRASPWALLALAWSLGADRYTHVYDAHNNLRSRLASAAIQARRWIEWAYAGAPRPRFARRPKHRLGRYLLFSWRVRSALPSPFRGAVSYLDPLRAWGVRKWPLPPGPQAFTSAPVPSGDPYVALAPSAAWEMKRWPVEHWMRLIELMPEARFVLLGGPEDGYCERIREVAPERVENLAGKRDLSGSLAAVAGAALVISNDTGLLHAADLMERPTLALIGPTAFGYPSGPRSETLEISLPCKPCTKDGRGRCVNSLYKRCLVELSPERVAAAAARKLQERA